MFVAGFLRVKDNYTMSDFVGIDIQGLKELHGKFDRLIPACQDSICETVADYLVKQFQLYPPPNHSITRAQAYPETGDGFFSVKQRKWFFWALNSGRINVPYHRTQDMRKAWKKYGSGKNVMVANETQAAVFTMDDERQARFSKLVGWKKTADIIRERHTEIERQASIGLKKGMKKAGFA
jgi:hypothetical protein